MANFKEAKKKKKNRAEQHELRIVKKKFQGKRQRIISWIKVVNAFTSNMLEDLKLSKVQLLKKIQVNLLVLCWANLLVHWSNLFCLLLKMVCSRWYY